MFMLAYLKVIHHYNRHWGEKKEEEKESALKKLVISWGKIIVLGTYLQKGTIREQSDTDSCNVENALDS